MLTGPQAKEHLESQDARRGRKDSLLKAEGSIAPGLRHRRFLSAELQQNKFLLSYSPAFLLTCYSSHGKLTHPLSRKFEDVA